MQFQCGTKTPSSANFLKAKQLKCDVIFFAFAQKIGSLHLFKEKKTK
jgi:hypothetical protein